MLAQVRSFVLQGVEAHPCEVEVDLADRGMVKTTIVGLPDASVKESVERVRSAMINSGFPFPMSRLLVNLAPAELKKEGPVYDLPIAVGLLLAGQSVEGERHRRLMFAGELALDGRLRPVKGAISLARLAAREGAAGLVVPLENAKEAAAAADDGLAVYPADSLASVVGFLNDQREIDPEPPVDADGLIATADPEVDFADVRGQEAVKRALTVAAAGGHNVLMVGPAGTGKTLCARALAGVLPPLSRAEALEATAIYSAAGQLNSGRSLVTHRPFRAPHHTASAPALIGGGSIPKPGEVSLAHHGVLFLDELPEFSRTVLETLRQPLEDGVVTIARAHSSIRFPARFMLVAAMNPTPGGDFATDESSQREMDRYLSRISGPLVDRVDIHVEVPRVPYRQLTGPRDGTDTATMRDAVTAARDRQADRPGQDGRPNATLSHRQLDTLAPLDEPSQELMKQAVNQMGLSARAYDKIRRLSRTIADLAECHAIGLEHVSEAIQYRLLDRRT